MPKTDYTIRSLEAALDVIESFIESDGTPLRFVDICRITGLNKNRTFRILATLAKRRYVEKDADTQQYRPGPAFLILGELYREQLDLRQMAKPILAELAETTGEAAHLFVAYGDQELCLELAVGEHPLQYEVKVGELWPFLPTGSALKFLLATFSDQDRARVISAMDFASTDGNVQSQSEFEQAMQQALQNGYYVADDLEPGARSISAPVRDQAGEIIATVTLVIPTVRFHDTRRQQLVDLVVDAASRLSEKLGYRSAKRANELL
jgi:IclR family KDG regulon transcriptional repressor